MLRIRNSAGHWIPFEIIASNQLHDPAVGGVIFTARDLRFRHEAERAIREANADFEKHLSERTMELAKANAALRIENQQWRHTEAQLQQSLSLLNATLESTADGILVISNDRKVSSCNQKFLEMWRIPRMAVAGLRDEDLLAARSARSVPVLPPFSFPVIPTCRNWRRTFGCWKSRFRFPNLAGAFASSWTRRRKEFEKKESRAHGGRLDPRQFRKRSLVFHRLSAADPCAQ